MKDFLPCRQHTVTSYSTDSNECLETYLTSGSAPTGQVSKDGKRVYVCCGSQVEVLDAKDGQRIASWSYGHRASSGVQHTAAAASETASAATSASAWAAPRILCADAVDDRASRLLLGLGLPPEPGSRVQLHRGLLCLFDVPSCKVIRAVELPYPVTSVSAVTTHFDGCEVLVPVERWKWSTLGGSHQPEGCLSYFAGVTAVGTEQGGIYVLDLCLDDDIAWGSSEMSPLICRVLEPPPLSQDSGHAWLIEQRRSCRSLRTALAFQLAGPRRGRYNYMRPDDYLLKALSSDQATVTSVQFVPEMGALCVGFAFGSFQLWSLSPLALDYSSRYEEGLPPVVAFAHQLPEDDPRNFCYLWVVYCFGSHVVDTSANGCSAAELVLHQLEYGGKSIDEHHGWTTFQELSTIAPRLEHRLLPDRDANCSADGGWFVACHTVPDVSKIPSNCYQHDSIDEDARNHGYLRNSGLCLFSWCALSFDQSSSKSRVTYQFSIFDINRWYHAQMPQVVRPAPDDDICPFFANYSLGDCSSDLNLTSLLDVAVDTGAISRYAFPVGIAGEQALWPSTLRLAATFMFGNCTIKATFLGLQEQVIQDIVCAGPSVLARPRAVHSRLVAARLAVAAASAIDDTEIREEVLSILLQHGQVDFILRCIREWSRGGDIKTGRDLRFLLHWVWSQAAKLKTSFDAAAVCLFDCNGVPLDESTARQLGDCSRQLSLLADVLRCLQDVQDAAGESALITGTGYQELSVKVTVLSLVTLYAKAVVWCHTVGMLPEDLRSSDDSFSNWLRLLRSAYDNERLELRQQVMLRALWRFARGASAAEEDDQDVLIIDGLVSECGDSLRALWSSSESETSLPYPPDSVHSMVTMLLLKDGDHLLKTFIFFYFVLDYLSINSDCIQNEQMTCTDDVINMFSMSESRANLMTGFWLLDHGRIEEGIDKLSDPSVVALMEPWQSRRVLTRLLSQDHHAAALRLVRLRQTRCASDDPAMLVLVALLANGCTREAFYLLREENSREADPDKIAALFSMLLDEWQKKRQLGVALSLPFSPSDEEFLVQYLTRHSRQDLVVMHKLRQACIDDALRLNRDIRLSERSADAEVRARNATRSIIVDWYARSIPTIRQRVAGIGSHYPHRRRGQNELRRPVPLSSVAIRSSLRRATPPVAAAASNESPPARVSSRPFLADILDQICELHEHERLERNQSVVADDPTRVGAAATDFVRRETAADDVATAAAASTAHTMPSTLFGPFMQTPMHIRSVARLVRPSPMSVKVCKKDEFVEPAVSPLKRPLSPSSSILRNADPPLAKNQRLNAAAAASTIGEQAWVLLQTPPSRRRSPLQKTRPGVTDTPVMKFALLPTPQSILKTRMPAAAEAQQLGAFASASGDTSNASVLTSTAKKGVSFVGLGASPTMSPGDSPIANAAVEQQRVSMMKNRRQTAIMPASGLKPLKEFGLPLPTPPRYDRSSTAKVILPSVAIASRLVSDGDEPRPKCILFDEDEEDSDEMLSADDASFSGHSPTKSPKEGKAEQANVRQSPRKEVIDTLSTPTAAVVNTSTALGVQQNIISSNRSCGTASAASNCCETGMQSTVAPCSFVSGSFDDATSAAASDALLESSDSAVTLSEGKTVKNGQQKRSSITHEDEAYKDAVAASADQAIVNLNEATEMEAKRRDEPGENDAEKFVEPASVSCLTSPAAPRQLTPDDTEHCRQPDGSNVSNAGGLPSPMLDAFAMSSGLALRRQIESAARLEASLVASAAYVRESQGAEAVASAVSDATLFISDVPAAMPAIAIETELAPAITTSDAVSLQVSLEPAVNANLPNGSTVGSSGAAFSPAVEQHRTQGTVTSDDRTTNTDISLATAMQSSQPVLGDEEFTSQTGASAPTTRGEGASVVTSIAEAGSSSVSTDAGRGLQHPKPVIRPFTFMPPASEDGDDQQPLSRSSTRRQAVRRRTAAVVGPVSGEPATGSTATGNGDQGSADHAAASGVSRRSLRPRASFKQDMAQAVGDLLEHEAKLPATAAAPAAASLLAHEIRRSSRRAGASSTSSVSVPATSLVTTETAEAAADSPATNRSKSTRSQPRSRQSSGNSATSSSGRASAATGAAAEGHHSYLPPLAESSAADAHDGSSSAVGTVELAVSARADRRSDSSTVAARKAARRGQNKHSEASTAITVSATGDDGDGSAMAVLPPPPSPFRDGRRRLRGTKLQLESEETAGGYPAGHKVSASATTSVAEPCVTPLAQLSGYAETQSQRSTRSRKVKAERASNTPLNFTPVSRASARKPEASSAARSLAAAVAHSPHEEVSASPRKMTLRSRQSKKS